MEGERGKVEEAEKTHGAEEDMEIIELQGVSASTSSATADNVAAREGVRGETQNTTELGPPSKLN